MNHISMNSLIWITISRSLSEFGSSHFNLPLISDFASLLTPKVFGPGHDGKEFGFHYGNDHWHCIFRGCVHDIGATFIPARVHSGSLLWLCIRLHDTNTKCHAGASHTGASLPRFLCWSEIFISARKFIPVSCKRGKTARFVSIKVSSILRHYKTRNPTNTALCKHGATFHRARNKKRAVIM